VKGEEKEMSCKKCGNCCVDFSVSGIGLYQMRDFLKEHPFLSYSGLSGLEIDKPVPKFKCSRLITLDNGLRVCSDYDNRPDFCRNHPSSEMTKFVGCTAEIVLERL